jgi:hypothetical protein
MALEERTLPSVSLISNFKGLDAHDAGSIIEPPDTIAAAGPTDVVEVVNSNIAVYTKGTGSPLLSEGLDVFFASVDQVANALFSDVYVTYDESVGRFFVSTMDVDFVNNQSFFDFAVSNDSDPMHGFTDMHQIETTEVSPRTGEPLFTDFPRVGWNADAYVITFNMTGFGSQNPYNTQVLTIDKASVTDNNASTLTYFQVDRPLPNSTMVPATMHGAQKGGPMWFVEEKGLEQDGTYKDLRLVEATNLLSSTPTFTDFYVPVDPYTITPFPSDTIGQVTTSLDTRILSADWRGGELVASQNVGLSTDMVVHARWYELSTSGATPALVQEGDLAPGAGVHTYMPSVALMANGTVGMTYMESSDTENMSMYVTGRTSADAPGSMESPALVQSGKDFYNGTRAGDFSGISVDPVSGTSFWAANEYATLQDPNDPLALNWGTWIGNFSVGTGQAATTTRVSASPFPSVVGQAVTFTATVRSATVGTPTGTITFDDFGHSFGSGTLDSTGHATFSTTSLPRGNHAITAVYSGDSNFAGSSSSPWGQTVNRDGTGTTLAPSSGSSVFGQTVTFTAAVTASSPGSGAPTGSVTFKDGTVVLGSATLGVVGGVDQATFPTKALAVGNHTITATYNGNVSFLGSISQAVQETVNPDATTTVVKASVNPSTVGQTVTLTASVRASLPGSGFASGTVTFDDFGAVLGTGTLSTGAVATFSISSLARGNHAITAIYGGDTRFTGSTSQAYGQTVNAAATSDLRSFNPSDPVYPLGFGSLRVEAASHASTTLHSGGSDLLANARGNVNPSASSRVAVARRRGSPVTVIEDW